ncbi:HAD hydrolase-like protein [Streptomyces mirabilis]
MVGDDPVADIAGAHAVGVPGILIDPSKDGLQPAAQRILGRPPMSWP